MKKYYKNRRAHGFGRHKHYYKKHYRGFKDRLNALASAKGIYRSRNGIFMGVCRGLADYFNLRVGWLRVIAVILFLISGFWPVGVLYIIAGLLLKLEPVSPLRDEYDQEFYDTYAHSRQSAIQRIKRKFENIERRIQRMEHTVTSKAFNWK